MANRKYKRVYTAGHYGNLYELQGYESNDGIFIEKCIGGYSFTGNPTDVYYRVEALNDNGKGICVFSTLKDAKAAIDERL